MNFWTGTTEFSGTVLHHSNLWCKESRKVWCPRSGLGVWSCCCVLWCWSWVPEAEAVSKPMQLPEQVRSKRALACTHTWQSSVAFLASVTWILGLFLPAEAWNDGFSAELATSTAMPVPAVLVFGVIFFLKKILFLKEKLCSFFCLFYNGTWFFVLHEEHCTHCSQGMWTFGFHHN